MRLAPFLYIYNLSMEQAPTKTNEEAKQDAPQTEMIISSQVNPPLSLVTSQTHHYRLR